MAKRPYKRRQILVDRFQYQFLLINLLYFLTILLIFSAALFLPLIIQLKSSTLSQPEQEAVAIQFLALHARVWPALLLAFLLLAIHSIIVSHRIAGPLLRFRNTFRVIGTGDLSVRVTIRKHDYLGNEADILNEMIAGLRTKIKDIEKPYEEACGVVMVLERAMESGSVENMDQNIDALRVQMGRLGASMEQFQIGPDETYAQRGAQRQIKNAQQM
jgi:methyl-accepting chemotaxis protein